MLVEPVALRTYFELLVNVYEIDVHGKSLVEWMKEDWQLFGHPAMDVAHAKELLGEILDNGEVVRKQFSPSSSYTSEGLVQWETLRDEMMYRNRWFLDMNIDTARLRQLLDMLLAQNLPKQWYRARIRSGDAIFSIDRMGAPPKRLASHGRANPAGIPYLYLGSKPETATAEIRPHTGEVACVAGFTVPEIQAVDLRNPRKFVSPFILSDASDIGQLRADIPFLERLGDELTRPVLPQGAAIDYIPSQYLCEFIKKSGFDGVVYRSSVSDGINLALFDPDKAQGGEVALYNISRVSVEVARA
ncbi:RES family NAD+ phosphorylase [Plastoroseomonas hellenica]|uniref:RES family NAD+ phosphorylase n=1 Tax=Plastoroseomonas hellenica TaxID=2687306 RepID=UPI001BA8245E|nr:RES family NAD+ phosphorylase [Plastoroseomonas hellenica]